MDIFRRDIAPISAAAWHEIDTMARDTLTANLSVRKFVDTTGPFGMDHAAVSIGRLEIPEGQKKDGVQFGIHQVQPLVETRIAFTLTQWELDNIERGAKDLELDNLVEAARQMADFEEEAVYNGFKNGRIQGIHDSIKGRTIDMSLEKDSIIDSISEAQARMMKDGLEGPANLVVNTDLWKYLARSVPGGTLRSIIEQQIQGKVIYSGTVKGALLASARGGDFDLTLGQDFAIGYHSHTSTEISLFMTESFTFRIITPEALIGFTLK